MVRPYEFVSEAVAALGKKYAGANRQLSELLSLHECVTMLSRAKSIEDLLEVYVFTVLGEHPCRSAAVYLKEEKQWVRAFYKGSSRAHVDLGELKQLESMNLQRGFIHLDDCEPELKHVLYCCNFDKTGASRFIPLINNHRLVGLLALGAPLIANNLEAKSQWLLDLSDLFGLILGNFMDNRSLESVNRTLEQRVFQLQTIREATDSFIHCRDRVSIFRALAQNLMGQFFISRSGFIEETSLSVIFQTGCKLEDVKNCLKIENHEQFLRLLPSFSLTKIQTSPKFAYALRVSSDEAGEFFLLLGPRLNGKEIETDDENLVIALARQAGSALDFLILQEQRLENERMLKELELARSIQQKLLPKKEPEIDGYEVSAEMRPFKQVGGDFFDWFELGNSGNWGFCLADVSGKSLPASMIMTTTQACLRALSIHTPASASRIIKRLNKQLCQAIPSNRFVTMFFGILDPESHVFTYINAGHNPPFLLKRNGKVSLLTDGGMVLGMFASAPYRVGSVEFNPGTELLIYTDGISELVSSKDEEYGDDRVLECFRQHSGKTELSEEKDYIFKDATRFSENKLIDDMTVVMIRRNF